MRKIEVNLEDILGIISYGTDYGAGALNEDIRLLAQDKITEDDIEEFIKERISNLEGFGEEDREEHRRIFKGLIKG